MHGRGWQVQSRRLVPEVPGQVCGPDSPLQPPAAWRWVLEQTEQAKPCQQMSWAALPQPFHAKSVSLDFLLSVFGEMVRDREAALKFRERKLHPGKLLAEGEWEVQGDQQGAAVSVCIQTVSSQQRWLSCHLSCCPGWTFFSKLSVSGRHLGCDSSAGIMGFAAVTAEMGVSGFCWCLPGAQPVSVSLSKATSEKIDQMHMVTPV